MKFLKNVAIVLKNKAVVNNYGSFVRLYLLSGIFILPLVYFPKYFIPYEVPKVYTTLIFIQLLTFLVLIKILLLREVNNLDKKIFFPVAFFFITVIISSAFSVDFVKSLRGNTFRIDGVLTLIHLILYSINIGLIIRKRHSEVTSAIAYSAIIISIWSLFDCFRFYILKDPNVYNWDGTFPASFGNPNFLAGYLLITLPFTYQLQKINHKSNITKYLHLVGILIQIITIILLKTWAGNIGLLFWIFLLVFKQKQKYRMLIGFSGIIFLIFLSFLYINFYKKLTQPQIILAEGRERIITKALIAFKQKPLFGWGYANFDYAFDAVDWPIKFNNDVYVDKAHSEFIEYLTTTGILGFLAYFYLLLSVLKKTFIYYKKTDDPTPMFVIILYIFHSQTNIISISETMIFWTITGVFFKTD